LSINISADSANRDFGGGKKEGRLFLETSRKVLENIGSDLENFHKMQDLFW
jgi:hypothetical protein